MPPMFQFTDINVHADSKLTRCAGEIMAATRPSRYSLTLSSVYKHRYNHESETYSCAYFDIILTDSETLALEHAGPVGQPSSLIFMTSVAALSDSSVYIIT